MVISYKLHNSLCAERNIYNLFTPNKFVIERRVLSITKHTDLMFYEKHYVETSLLGS